MKNLDNLFLTFTKLYAQQSHCESFKVAAIAVKENRILYAGINGTPKGYTNCDAHFFNLFKQGYANRYPIQNPDDFTKAYQRWIKTPEWREMHHAWSLKYELHAEHNLITGMAKHNISPVGITVYLTMDPCETCMKLLIGAEVKRIVYIDKYDKTDESSIEFARSVGIEIIQKGIINEQER